LNIITKKIDNKIIFYDKDVGINIEELFSSGVFLTDESQNVEWINDGKWVKKHYFRKGMMSFLNDWYLHSDIKSTRSYREFEILNYLYKYSFNTCKPLIGWITYSGILYKANLVTEAIPAITLNELLIQKSRDYEKNASISSTSLNYERPELFKQIGIKVAQMHILGIYHGDLNINNIMISADPLSNDALKVWILDFDKSFRKHLVEKDRALNLRRFQRSLIKNKQYLPFDYETFLSSYFLTINA
jgi:tRNA A-37 threonylcarbamoyl transferase component Bud32